MSSAKYQRPNSAEARSEAAQDIISCRALLQENSRTFFAASLLLPKAVREPSLALYAFCRVADDAVDLHADKHGAVADLMDRLTRLYDGQPSAASADRAFADVATRFNIPREIPQALIEGFAWDAEFRRYETLDDLYGYAARVAGTVGVMMALLMGARSASALARACDLGVAMQLSNIARDVGEDAAEKRLFLPLEWLRAEAIDADTWLEKPSFTPSLGRVVQRLLAAADALYDRVGQGIAELPATCRPGISAARTLYQEIGRQVERNSLDSVTQRAVVSGRRKAALLSRGLMLPLDRSGSEVPAPLAQATFLIRAVVDSDAASAAAKIAKTAMAAQINRNRPTLVGQSVALPTLPWWNIQDRALWLVDLFERLERADHERVSS